MTTLRLTATQALDRAFSAYRAGKLLEAEQLCQKIIEVTQDFFDALYLVAVIQSRLGKKQSALANYDRAIALRPTCAEALHDRGNVLKELRRFDEALASYERAIALRPNNAEAEHMIGIIAHQSGKLGEAIEHVHRAISISPDVALYHADLCEMCRQAGHIEEAIAAGRRALELNPDYPDALNNVAIALFDQGKFEEALAHYDRAIALKESYARAHSNRGNVLVRLKRFAEAEPSYRRALELEPSFAAAWHNLGACLQELKRPKEAEAAYRKALALKPDFADAYTNMGNVLKELGRHQEAEKAVLEVLRLDPKMTGAYLNLTDFKKFSRGDAHLLAMEALAAKTEGLSVTDRMQLDFALGKAYADLKDYDRSFRHLLAGNAAKRATTAYDEKLTFELFDRIEALFTHELIAAKSGEGDPSAAPIFVIGMPRSGTTLVEQIIASHPLVHGAGELRILNDLVIGVRKPDNQPLRYPEFVAAIDAAALRQIGARYVALLRETAVKHAQAPAERIIDKMPSNYYFAGLIHLSLPNATIIHTVRDPVDTCISCFSKLFSFPQNHTYDLGELGRYHRRYQQLMAHWHRVLPTGRILDVRYEDVVADLAVQARRVIGHCGLPWDDHCLAFHETNRPIGSTASAMQVRQPIYNSAVGRWRVYQQHLEPLLSALGIESAGVEL